MKLELGYTSQGHVINIKDFPHRTNFIHMIWGFASVVLGVFHSPLVFGYFSMIIGVHEEIRVNHDDGLCYNVLLSRLGCLVHGTWT